MAEQTTEVVPPAQDLSICGSLVHDTHPGHGLLAVLPDGAVQGHRGLDLDARFHIRHPVQCWADARAGAERGTPFWIRIPILVLAAGLMSVAMPALALAGMIAHGTPTCCTPAPDLHRGTTPSPFLEF